MDAEAEGRVVKATQAGAWNLLYDLAGREVAEVPVGGAWSRGEIYAGGRHLATYSSGAAGMTYFTHADWLGTERARTDAFGSALETCTSLPFGDAMVCSAYDPSPMHFTAKERDSESGLDNFGARYFGSWLGRFMSPDPSMESAIRRLPQSWNRYSYTINNPLRFIDPTGELWTRSGDNNNPYMWVDTCGEGQSCVDQIAAQVGQNVMVYGTNDAQDIQTLTPNENGYIDLDELAGASGANFQFQQGITAIYGSAQTAVDLYNSASDYHDLHPNDAKLSLNDAGIDSGNNFDPHQTHNLGRSIDMSYVDANGNPLHVGNLGVWRADDGRMQDLVRIFRENGFNQNYSDNNVSLGTQWAPGHMNHIHFGKTLGLARCEIGPCR